jgi:hypothetical protein
MESLEYPSRSPNLKLLEFYVWDDLKHTAYDRKQRTLQDWSLKLKLLVLLFLQQQRQKYVTLLHVVVINAFGLMVYILNICDFKVTNTTIG